MNYWSKSITEGLDKQIKNANSKTKKSLKKERKKRVDELKKGYILHNCNPGCKNTLLEPGPPEKVPKSSKDLKKMFIEQRKSIFKNKTNVLINNFHENTPKKLKKQLLKEGAISQCVPM